MLKDIKELYPETDDPRLKLIVVDRDEAKRFARKRKAEQAEMERNGDARYIEPAEKTLNTITINVRKVSDASIQTQNEIEQQQAVQQSLAYQPMSSKLV